MCCGKLPRLDVFCVDINRIDLLWSLWPSFQRRGARRVEEPSGVSNNVRLCSVTRRLTTCVFNLTHGVFCKLGSPVSLPRELCLFLL